MINNLINKDDFLETWRRIKSNPSSSLKIFQKIVSQSQTKVELTWSHTKAIPDKWWFIPQIQKRWNHLITGNKETSYQQYFAEKYLFDRNDYSAFSFACGNGEREILWAKTKRFSLIDSFDLSKARIMNAIQNAKNSNVSNIVSFSIGNANSIILEKKYDVYFAEQSLHHFSPLENVLKRLKNFLKPNGWLLINEYTGPDRFQWTKEQIKYSNYLLKEIPELYRKYWNCNQIKSKIYKPGKLRMMLNDPSEAVESSKIIPLLDKYFERIEIKNYGGTILHLVLDGIAHNFLSNDDETNSLLEKCFLYEDELINTGKLPSDFVFAVYKNTK